MEEKTLLSVRDLTVRFKVRGQTLTALRGISLDLYEGESLAIVGESGSGKSVLTKSFSGMLDANGTIEGGKLLFRDGDEVVDLTGFRNRDWARLRGGKIATVFQDPMTSLDPIVTIGRQITAVIRKHQKCGGAEARRRALDMMEKVGNQKQNISAAGYDRCRACQNAGRLRSL